MIKSHTLVTIYIINSVNSFISLEFDDYLKRGLSPVTIGQFQIDIRFKETVENQIKHHFGDKIGSVRIFLSEPQRH